MKKNWSSWIKLTEENLEVVPRTPGVYKIGYPGAKIPRFWQVDEGEEGRAILYIGEGSNVRQRLREFLKVIKGKKGRHIGGVTFLNLYLDRIFDIEKIEFKFKETESGEEAMEEEYKLLKDYEEIYGDFTPLNKKMEEPSYILYIYIRYNNYYEPLTIEARYSLDKLLEKFRDKEKINKIKEFFVKIKKGERVEEKVNLEGKFVISIFNSVWSVRKDVFSSENMEEALNILNLSPVEVEKIKRKIEWIKDKPRRVREYLRLER